MSRTVADLSLLLSVVTGADGVGEAIDRALSDAGVAPTVSDADDGPIEEGVRRLALTRHWTPRALPQDAAGRRSPGQRGGQPPSASPHARGGPQIEAAAPLLRHAARSHGRERAHTAAF